MGRYKGKSISLERKEPMQMDNIMPLFLKAMRLSAGMDVHLVLSAWDKVTRRPIYIVEISEGWCPHLRDIVLCRA